MPFPPGDSSPVPDDLVLAKGFPRERELSQRAPGSTSLWCGVFF